MDDLGQPGQDGLPEIAVAGAGGVLFQFNGCDSSPLPHRIDVLRNLGTWDTDPAGSLVVQQTIQIDPINGDIWGAELAFADMSGTNGPDLVLTGYDPILGIGYLLIYRNLGTGMFDTIPVQAQTNVVTLRGMVVADLDLDGGIDVAAAASDCNNTSNPDDALVIFENRLAQTGQLSFVTSAIALDISGDAAPGDIVAGDFYPLLPGQPLLDLVTPNPLANSIAKAANLGNLNFSAGTEQASGECAPGWGFVTAASGQFGSDSHWDFAAVLPEADYPDALFLGVFRGQGLGSFQSYCDVPALGYELIQQNQQEKLHAHGIDTGNVNGGQNLDLVVALRQDTVATEDPEWHGAVAVLVGRSDGTFKTKSPQEAYIFSAWDPNDPDPKSVAGTALVDVVDLNGDGLDDIVVTNNETDNISVLINKLLITNPG